MLKYRLQFTKPKRIMKINVVRILHMFGCKCNHIQASFTNTNKVLWHYKISFVV